MSDRIIAALIIGASLLGSAYMLTGGYQVAGTTTQTALVMDRHSDQVWLCFAGDCGQPIGKPTLAK
jgi:hypothetical protein